MPINLPIPNSTALAAVLLSGSDDCSASGTLDCRLHSILSFLYVAAAILAVVLIIVAALALWTYLKNKSETGDRP